MNVGRAEISLLLRDFTSLVDYISVLLRHFIEFYSSFINAVRSPVLYTVNIVFDSKMRHELYPFCSESSQNTKPDIMNLPEQN
jgi:hypothetical protein